LSWLGDRDGEAAGVRSDPVCVVNADGAVNAGELGSAPEHRRSVLRLNLVRFGRTRAVLTVERGGEAFGARDVDWLRALLPTLILADEGTAMSTGPSRALTPREADVVEYVRLGYTNAQIALATGRSVAAVRNVLVRIFDKTGVRTRAQLVGGPLTTSGLTRREREIVEKLRAGLTNREIGRDLGISANTVRNTLCAAVREGGRVDAVRADGRARGGPAGNDVRRSLPDGPVTDEVPGNEVSGNEVSVTRCLAPRLRVVSSGGPDPVTRCPGTSTLAFEWVDRPGRVAATSCEGLDRGAVTSCP
jgi:DNA-binding CsgD family transcriptional regulator